MVAAVVGGGGLLCRCVVVVAPMRERRCGNTGADLVMAGGWDVGGRRGEVGGRHPVEGGDRL